MERKHYTYKPSIAKKIAILEKNVINKHQSGIDVFSIAKNLSISKGYVYYILKKNEIPLRKGLSYKSITLKSRNENVLKDYEHGMKLDNLFSKYSLSRSHIYNILKNQGIVLRIKKDKSEQDAKREQKINLNKQLITEYAKGTSIYLLAEKFSLLPLSVRYLLKRNKIKLRREKRITRTEPPLKGEARDKRDQEVFKAYNLGMKVSKVAEDFNLRTITIYKILNRGKVELRNQRREKSN